MTTFNAALDTTSWIVNVNHQLNYLERVKKISRKQAILEVRKLKDLLELGYKANVFKFVGGTKQLHIVRNEIRSILDALNTKDSNLKCLAPKTTKDLIHAVSLNRINVAQKQHFSEQGLTPKEVRHVEEDKAVQDMLYDFRNDISDILLNLKHTKFAYGNAPIIPMLKKGRFIDNKLKGYGIPTQSLAGYTVIERQQVIVINPKAIDVPADTYLKTLIASISQATGQKLKLVVKKSSAYKGYLWYWVATSKVIDHLLEGCNYEMDIKLWSISA